MKRPELSKETIIKGAIEFCKCFDMTEYEAHQIARHYNKYENSYELCKDLERYECWHIDAQVVENMDCIEGYVDTEYKKVCKKWFEDNDIQPPLSIGTTIKEGVIKGIYEYDVAYYKVKRNGCNQDGRYGLIKFENAVEVK